MPLTLIADWLYPADPPPMKRLSKINQLHRRWPLTRPQFMVFTQISFPRKLFFNLLIQLNADVMATKKCVCC